MRVEFREVRPDFFKVIVPFSRKERVKFKEVRARGILRKVRVHGLLY